MATIEDVAKLAEVSTRSVSRYISGVSVRAETARRIDEAAKQLEFYPSAAARTLKGQSPGIISLITDNLTTTPWSFDIIKGVQEACDQHGKLLLIGETRNNPHMFDKLVTQFRQYKTEAIIKAAYFHRPVQVTQQFEFCPLVLVNCFDTNSKYPCILPDDEQGAYDLTNRLVSLGHEKIAFITLPEDLIATKLRLKGYKRALQSNNLKLDQSLIFTPESLGRRELSEWHLSILKTLVSLNEPPTAIMCGKDTSASNIIMHLKELGIRVPQDISVVGFDNYKVIAENCVPPITTVSLPYYEMGQRAAKMAIGLADKSIKDPKSERCRCEIIPRESDKER
ncbi:MAG: substrate-binding domain-containing protein [Gammaproteobacteria bacterium]|uniref:LacI family DNA-binding transcriptional regulator n=1 Tax=Pseudomaricurvus alcaniphilus TaxID=1166482 RepID=UPI00140E2249|nr:LacI family DNA-binding transcriptional regulator [Pseudomaricurvus alcaniphilus]MBR9911175.1 substrate-binding domain-containing protein [Gammaproteobacteria bacterium]NHN36345.1 substrate-binding domain-containing protein [Pseudomaricurvus alcaniphilus]